MRRMTRTKTKTKMSDRRVAAFSSIDWASSVRFNTPFVHHGIDGCHGSSSSYLGFMRMDLCNFRSDDGWLQMLSYKSISLCNHSSTFPEHR